MPATESPWRRALLGLGMFVAYLIPAVVALWHVWAHPSSTTLGYGSGDTAQYVWYMRFTEWAVLHGHNPFITHVINYPFGVNLVDNTPMSTLGLLGTPITAVWGPVVTLNVWWTLAYPLSAGAGYLLARRFTTWRPAAFVAGLLYGFSPFMVAQGAGHLPIFFVAIPPLILLVLHELFVRQQGSPYRWGAALAVLILAQFFVSSEILASTAFFAVLATLVVVIRWRHVVAEHLRHAVAGIATAVPIVAVVLAFPLYEFVFGAEHISGSVIGFRYYYSAVAAPLLPTPLMHFTTPHVAHLGSLIGGNNVENGTYLGLPLVLLVVAAPFLVRRRPALRVAAVMAAVCYVLSLGTRLDIGIPRFAHLGQDLRNFPLPASLIYHTPVLNDSYPVRYAVWIVLFVSIVLAICLEEVHRRAGAGRPQPAHGAPHGARLPPWLRRSSPARAAVAPLLVAVVVLLPLLPAWPYAGQGPNNVPGYFSSSQVDALPAGGVALVYPLATNLASQPELWQAVADLRFKMPGGYFVLPASSGHNNNYYTATLAEATLSAVLQGPTPRRTPALRAALRSELRAWDVRSIVAQPVGHDPVGFFTWLTGRPPTGTGAGVVLWYHLSL